MEINEGGTYYGKNFSGLYFDSYSLVLAAGEIGKLRPESVLPFTLCRNAILSAAISLECAANCCLVVLDDSGAITNAFDKLDPLAKLHYFTVRYCTPNMIDRSRREFKLVNEVKKIRNDYVHPKVLKGIWEKVSDGRYQVKSNCKEVYPALDILKEPVVWDIPDAVAVIKAVTEFFNYFFVEVCEFSPAIVCAILTENEKFDPSNAHAVMWSFSSEIKKFVETRNIVPHFLGWVEPNNRIKTDLQ